MSRKKHVATAIAGLIFGAATVILAAGQPAQAGPRISPARAPAPQHAPQRGGYSSNEIIDAGHRFFGTTTKGLARAVESVFRKKGRPTGYIIGEEASGAFIGGVRYGEGVLYLKTGGRRKVFWQGPTIGLDAGGNGAKVLMLVYNIDLPRQIFSRFFGVSGSAYIVGGLGVSYHDNARLTVVPIRSGIGARLGASVGYLKMTARPTWNPF
ncbi:MAG TPA: DUF1134 domain-containing protein [Thermopetrobacter sp.]|nr:DUF1134 domain-containing protein [Thermopetrobacter sp.]